MKNPTPRLDLNPSSAERWTTCTASPHFIVENWGKVPERDETVYNREGTAAHEVAHALLEDRAPAETLGRGEDQWTPSYDEAIRSHAWAYMEYIFGLMEPGAKLLVEQKLPLWYMPGRNAIVDAVVCNPDSLHIVDYKYGEGVPVSPEQNLQLVIYAKSILTSGDFKLLADDFPVFLHIYQPRGREGSGGVWETTLGEIAALSSDISLVAKGIQDEVLRRYGEFRPSESACRWCPAKGFCKAREDSFTSDLTVLKEPELLPTTNVLTDEQIAKVLTHSDQIKKWLDDVEEFALNQLQAGHKIPGFKLVMSRGGNRQWSDPQKAKGLLLSQTVLKATEVVEEKVIGPTAAEKLLGKRSFSPELTNLIVKAPGSPVIAPEDDKREAIGQGILNEISEVVTP